MSWATEDGWHEGYAAHVTLDGRESEATTNAGMILAGRDDQGRRVEDVVAWSALLGWEARCTCGWRGPLYRALGGDYQDAAELVLEDAAALGWDGGPATAEDAIRAAWEHHAARRGAY